MKIIILSLILIINSSLAFSQSIDNLVFETNADLSIKESKSEEPNSQDLVNVNIEQTLNSIKVNFNWLEDVGCVIYEKNDKLWIIFDKYKLLNINEFSDSHLIDIMNFSDKLTIVSIDNKKYKNKFKNIFASKFGYQWVIEINNRDDKRNKFTESAFLDKSTNIIVNIFTKESLSEPIKFFDSLNKENIIVVSSKSTANGIFNKKIYIDFEILNSFQGIAILPINDHVNFNIDEQQVKISAKLGSLSISDELIAKIDSDSKTMKQPLSSLLNLKKFETSGVNFIENIRTIQRDIVLAEDINNSKNLYLNLALSYLANGYYLESSLIIKLIEINDVSLSNSPTIKLIKAIIHFKGENFIEADKILNSIDITDILATNRKEIHFLKGLINNIINKKSDDAVKIDLSSYIINDQNNFLNNYTEPLKLDFSIAILKQLIQKDQTDKAKKLWDKINSFKIDKHNQNKLNLIKYTFDIRQNNDEEAIDELNKCIDDWHDDFNYVQCTFNLLKYKFDNNQLNVEEYTKSLANLSLIWKGDEYEIKILKELGDIFFENKNYTNALKWWRKITIYYPFSLDSIAISKKLNTTFIDFFTNDLDQNVSHLEAVSLFYEFDSLLPIGRIGDQIVLRLVDHLIALDLLDRATNLLKHQITYRLWGQQRERLVNKLAEIYILDKHPELAIDTIQLSNSLDVLPQDVSLERKYLLSVAYLKNDQIQDAVNLLQSDQTIESDDINSQLFWNLKNWNKYNYYAEPFIYSIRNNNSELNYNDSLKILRLSISYLINNQKQLFYDLQKDFYNRISNNGINLDLFNVLNQISKTESINSVMSLNQLVKFEDNINNFLNKLKSSN